MFVEAAYRESPTYRAFWDTLRQGTCQVAEFKRIARGDRDVWIQATYNPILDASGCVLNHVDVFQDAPKRSKRFSAHLCTFGAGAS